MPKSTKKNFGKFFKNNIISGSVTYLYLRRQSVQRDLFKYCI